MAKKKSKKKERRTPLPNELKGVILLAGSLFILLSLISFAIGSKTPLLGLMGYTIGLFFHALLGISSYFLCLYGTWLGWRLLFNKPINNLFIKTGSILLLITSSSILLSLIEEQDKSLSHVLEQIFYPDLLNKNLHYHLGGAPFYFLYRDLPYLNLQHVLNWFGVLLVFFSLWCLSFFLLTKTSLKALFQWGCDFLYTSSLFTYNKPIPIKEKSSPAEPAQVDKDSDFLRYVKLRSSEAPQELAIRPDTVLKQRPSLSKKESKDLEKKEEEWVAPKKSPVINTSGLNKETPDNFTEFKLPNASLLTTAKKIDQSSLKKDLRRQAEVLEETLQSFGIEAKVGQINCGPTINSFEVHPAIGVKVQKIKTLENDIALNMEAKSIRIIAPIPGKAAVGIEVPNPCPQEVGFKEMLAAYQQEGGPTFRIPILLGKAVNGDYVMSDLTKWPHCIIAGATGSGKSVCINTIVMSIVMNAKPDEIKLVMVDPKKVELTPYTALPHMLAPVITEPKDACTAMNWLVKEMERRYEVLKLTGTRNIETFNARRIDKEFEASLETEIPLKMPYIVGIIDELADLMMVSSSDIETPIARIAQMARAVGIHLILATQRPSREVITGLIKANFPTRISFKVASRVNSQIVLDDVGAEALLGNGDLLFLPPGSSHLIRAQGAFIRDEDILAVVKHLTQQAPPNYLIQSFSQLPMSDIDMLDDEEPGDTLYEDAKDIILSTGNASTTFLQRKLKIGYARAASLIDQLEMRGVVGPAEGSKPRKILMAKHVSEPLEEDLED